MESSPVNDRASPAPVLALADPYARNLDGLLLAGRIFVGAIFVLSGVLKLTGVAAYSTRGWPAEWFFGPLGASVELFGGALVIAGLATRYGCVIMFLFMIVATFSAHRFWDFADPAQFRAQQSQFFKNVSIFGGFILIFALGPGRFSLDHVIRRRAQKQDGAPAA
jgi:putative oxidoreductase